MDHFIFTARSVTHAQRMAQVLERSGIYVSIHRAGAAITGNGCGYTLQVPSRQFKRASELLRSSGQHPVKAFHVINGQRQEVAL
ncbi:MAG: DUF3343 domain-containing protein [Oscillospiraceae bacterium]|nr:DUF3343 domain-containing protein [Oscillospiraceae bacterium]